MHGTKDSIIGMWHGQKLFELANEPKQFVAISGADHNDSSPAITRITNQALAQFASTLEAYAEPSQRP